MKALDSKLTRAALHATGQALLRRGHRSTVRLVLAGGTAGLLAGLFKATRTTADCDVMWLGDDAAWRDVSAAAKEAADALELPANWLNRECSIYAWCMPLGWQSRCEPVGTFGPLEVQRIARTDLIAAQVMSCPRRPQDLEDLRDMGPTANELAGVEAHLDRLEMEDLDGSKFEDQRAVLKVLRGES